MNIRHLLLVSLLLATLGVAAVELKITPRHPFWKDNGDGSFTLTYDGSRCWPKLELQPASLTPDATYRLTFEARQTAPGPQPQVGCEETMDGKTTIVDYVRWQAGPDFSPFACYFRILPGRDTSFFFNTNPGAPASIVVRNIRLEQIDPMTAGNLFLHGDFECGSMFTYGYRSAPDSIDIVPSPDFLCGRKSLRLSKRGSAHVDAVTMGSLPALPGKTVVISFWARTVDGKTTPLRVNLDFYQDSKTKHLYRMRDYQVDGDWKNFSFEFPVPTDVKTYTVLERAKARLHLGLPETNAPGEVFIDGLDYRLK